MLPDEWRSKARDALSFARAGFGSSGIPGITCFLSHQSAELALKGFIASRGTEPPRVHDLPRLLFLCRELDSSFSGDEADVLLLNPWYIPGRYPVQHAVTATRSDGEEAIAAAERILEASAGDDPCQLSGDSHGTK